MIFLKIEDKKAYFILEEKKIEPEEISRDDLLNILNLVYEEHRNIIFPEDEEFSSIVNPIEKEIVEQITAKIKEFHSNVPSIKEQINNQFPEINY